MRHLDYKANLEMVETAKHSMETRDFRGRSGRHRQVRCRPGCRVESRDPQSDLWL